MANESASLALLVAVSIINSFSQILMRWGGLQATQKPGATPTAWQWLWVSRWWLSGILVGWIAGLGWAWCLRRLPLGMAIPLYAGLVYVLSITSGAYFLKERMSSAQMVGVATILIGILMVTLSGTPSLNSQLKR